MNGTCVCLIESSDTISTYQQTVCLILRNGGYQGMNNVVDKDQDEWEYQILGNGNESNQWLKDLCDVLIAWIVGMNLCQTSKYHIGEGNQSIKCDVNGMYSYTYHNSPSNMMWGMNEVMVDGNRNCLPVREKNV
jgi:hypothetical protein